MRRGRLSTAGERTGLPPVILVPGPATARRLGPRPETQGFTHACLLPVRHPRHRRRDRARSLSRAHPGDRRAVRRALSVHRRAVRGGRGGVAPDLPDPDRVPQPRRRASLVRFRRVPRAERGPPARAALGCGVHGGADGRVPVGSTSRRSDLLQRVEPGLGGLDASLQGLAQELGAQLGDLDLTLEAAQHAEGQVAGGGLGEPVLDRSQTGAHLALVLEDQGDLSAKELQIDLGQAGSPCRPGGDGGA